MITRRLLANLDWFLLAMVTLISGIGLVTIYSASHSLGLGNYYFYRQLLWFVLGLAVVFITVIIDHRRLCQLALPLHILVIILLIITLFYGEGSSNAPSVRRWLDVAGLRLQTSELAKFTIILLIAQYFKNERKFGNFKWLDFLWLGAIIGIPFILVVRQPDLGTALLFLLTSGILIYFGGLSYRFIIICTALIFICTPVIWKYGIAEYQKDRIITVFKPNQDLLGKGYHINQSVIAVGSGGPFGKGYLQGSQAQLNFLPARHTDFIFALFAEEWGFVGGILLIGLYCMLIWYCIRSVGHLKYPRENIIIVGVTTVIALHSFTNIAMVIRLLPVVGIPLPFFSYGGSSMLTMMFGIGLIMSIRCRRFKDAY